MYPIGAITIPNRVAIAPIAGGSNYAFCLIVK